MAATNVVVVQRVYYIHILKKAICSTKTYEHNLLNNRYVVYKHQCHADAFGVFVCEDHDKLPWLYCVLLGHLNFMKNKMLCR